MRFLALPQEDGQWASLCLDYDIASQGDTAQEAAENCRQAVEESLRFVAETPGMEMQPPPPAEAIMQFFRDAKAENNTTNAFYLLDYNGG
jgi:hypothetical protein